jgi:hypothetical protein
MHDADDALRPVYLTADEVGYLLDALYYLTNNEDYDPIAKELYAKLQAARNSGRG